MLSLCKLFVQTPEDLPINTTKMENQPINRREVNKNYNHTITKRKKEICVKYLRADPRGLTTIVGDRKRRKINMESHRIMRQRRRYGAAHKGGDTVGVVGGAVAEKETQPHQDRSLTT